MVFLFKKWVSRSFPLFWWAMWVNRSGRSPKMSDVSKSLRTLTKNERPWAIRSHLSEEMSDRERIAQVTHQKWANEWNARFFEQITHLLIFGQKTSDSLRKPMSKFPALADIQFFFWKWGYCYWLAFNKLLDIKNAILGVFQGWAPHSFTFWMHRSFAFF